MSTNGKDLEKEVKVGERQLVMTEWMSELLHLALRLKELNVSDDKRLVLFDIVADLNEVKADTQYKLNELQRSIKEELVELKIELLNVAGAKQEINEVIDCIYVAFRKNQLEREQDKFLDGFFRVKENYENPVIVGIMDELREKAEALFNEDKLSDAVDLIKYTVDEVLKHKTIEKSEDDLEFLREIKGKVDHVTVRAIAAAEIKEERRKSMAVNASPEKVKALLQYYLNQAASKEGDVNADSSLKPKAKKLGATQNSNISRLKKQKTDKNLPRLGH